MTVRDRIAVDLAKHYPGGKDHDQQNHGNRRGSPSGRMAETKRFPTDDEAMEYVRGHPGEGVLSDESGDMFEGSVPSVMPNPDPMIYPASETWGKGDGEEIDPGVIEYEHESTSTPDGKAWVRKYTVDGHRVAVRRHGSSPEIEQRHVDLIRAVPDETWEAAREPSIIFTDTDYMATLESPSGSSYPNRASGLYWAGSEVADTRGWSIYNLDGEPSDESNLVFLLDDMSPALLQHNMMHEIGHSVWFHDVYMKKKMNPFKESLKSLLFANPDPAGVMAPNDWEDADKLATDLSTVDLWGYPREMYTTGGPYQSEVFSELFAYMAHPRYDETVTAHGKKALDHYPTDDSVDPAAWLNDYFGGDVPRWKDILASKDTVDVKKQFTGQCGVPELTRLMFGDRDEVKKRLSSAFGNKRRRQNQLVARLKRKRGYAKPVPGGTGKQKRTRRTRFAKQDGSRSDGSSPEQQAQSGLLSSATPPVAGPSGRDITKHYGPGPHPSGTPQMVHGEKGRRAMKSALETARYVARNRDESYPIDEFIDFNIGLSPDSELWVYGWEAYRKEVRAVSAKRRGQVDRYLAGDFISTDNLLSGKTGRQMARRVMEDMRDQERHDWSDPDVQAEDRLAAFFADNPWDVYGYDTEQFREGRSFHGTGKFLYPEGFDEESWGNLVDGWREGKVNQVEALAERATRQIAEHSDVYVQVHESTLEELLGDGRFVTIFDPEADRAIGEGFGTEHREDYERRTFGINSEWLPPDKRPVYGYLWDDDRKDGAAIPESALSLGDERAALMNYGHVAIRLKDSVRDRTTFTFGDSFSLEGGVLPTPLVDPGWQSHGYLGGIISRGMVGRNPTKPTDGMGWDNGWSYIEAQVHGGVNIDDIDEIILPNRDDVEHYDSITKWSDLERQLNASGVKWRVIGDPLPQFTKFTKHYGPGPHKSGSSQDLHGKKGSSKPKPSTSSGWDRPELHEDRDRFEAALDRVSNERAEDERFLLAAYGLKEAFPEYDSLPFHTKDEQYLGPGSASYISDDAEIEWMLKNHPDVYEELMSESPNQFWERHVRRRTFELGYSDVDMAEAVVAMENFLDESHPFVRVDSGVLEQILYDGEIMNQLDSGTSNGWFSPGGRRQLDEILYGIDPVEDDAVSPVYGYFLPESGIGSDAEWGEWSNHVRELEHYGNVAIQLRDDVSATFTVGDSLDDSGLAGGSFFMAGVLQIQDMTGWNAGMTAGTRGYVDPADLDGPLMDIRDGGIGTSTKYIEAQFHEQITFEDIKAIHMPSWVFEEYAMDNGVDTAEDLRDAILPPGIEIVVYE